MNWVSGRRQYSRIEVTEAGRDRPPITRGVDGSRILAFRGLLGRPMIAIPFRPSKDVRFEDTPVRDPIGSWIFILKPRILAKIALWPGIIGLFFYPIDQFWTATPPGRPTSGAQTLVRILVMTGVLFVIMWVQRARSQPLKTPSFSEPSIPQPGNDPLWDRELDS